MPAGGAFWDGYDARLRGEARDACPYPEGSPKARDWLEGYDDQVITRLFGDDVGGTETNSA